MHRQHDPRRVSLHPYSPNIVRGQGRESPDSAAAANVRAGNLTPYADIPVQEQPVVIEFAANPNVVGGDGLNGVQLSIPRPDRSGTGDRYYSPFSAIQVQHQR